MLTLHQFEGAFGVPNASPFCLKRECFLWMAGVPYRTEPLRDLATAHKRNGPFITDEDGTRIGDSALIIAHLKRARDRPRRVAEPRGAGRGARLSRDAG